MADRCANTAATRILYLREEAVLRKPPRFNQSIDCSAEAIRRSSWPIRYFLEKSNQTRTPNYCTPRRMRAEG